MKVNFFPNHFNIWPNILAEVSVTDYTHEHLQYFSCLEGLIGNSALNSCNRNMSCNLNEVSICNAEPLSKQHQNICISRRM